MIYIQIIMSKSKEKWGIKKELPKRDYTKLPLEIESVVTKKPNQVTKTAKITFDGRQYLVRIPNKISSIMIINDYDRIEFTAITPSPKSSEEKKLVMRLIKS